MKLLAYIDEPLKARGIHVELWICVVIEGIGSTEPM